MVFQPWVRVKPACRRNISIDDRLGLKIIEKLRPLSETKRVLITKLRDFRSIPVATSAYLASMAPFVEPSWALVPLTLKLTPLGALDLTSTFAIRMY